MNTPPRADRSPARDPRKAMVLLGAIGLASLTTVSAHMSRASIHLTSPQRSFQVLCPRSILPSRLAGECGQGSTGLRVACSYVGQYLATRPRTPGGLESRRSASSSQARCPASHSFAPVGW